MRMSFGSIQAPLVLQTPPQPYEALAAYARSQPARAPPYGSTKHAVFVPSHPMLD